MKTIDDLDFKVPLNVAIQVQIQATIIMALTDLGYRPEEAWSDTDEDNEKLYKIQELAKQTTEWILEDIKKCEKNGGL